MSILLVEESLEFAYSSNTWIPTDYPLSVSMWFLDNNGADNARCIFQITDTGAADQYLRGGLDWISAGNIAIRLTVNNGTPQGVSTVNTYAANSWNHGYFEFASSTSREVSLNGGTRATNATSLTFPTGIDSIAIGYEYDSDPIAASGDPWDGEIAHFAVWNVALSVGESQALAAGASPLQVRPQNLQIYLPLWGNSSGRYIDLVRGFDTWNENGTPVKGDGPLESPTAFHRGLGVQVPQSSIKESAIVAGGKHVRLKLHGDTWLG